MQANGRFIQYVKSADQVRAERGRKLNALRFTARERGREAVEREVVQTHFIQKLQARAYLFEDFVCDFQLRLGKLHTRKKPARFLDRKLADIRDGFPRDPHGSRFGAQTRAAALGTAGVAAVAAQKHTHMQLIFLALQPLEKPLHPLIIVFRIAFEHQAPVLRGELPPRNARRNAPLARPRLQTLEKSAIARLGPGLDRAFFDGFAGIGYDQIQVKINGVAKALAARTRAVRTVERRKPRLRFLIQRAVIFAFESFVETQTLARFSRAISDKFENSFALPFAIADLDGVHQTRARFGIHGQAIHKHIDWLGRESRIALDRKSTRLNSSHQIISYAVFCLKKKKKKKNTTNYTIQ